MITIQDTIYMGTAAPASGGGGSGDAVWGDITGSLSNQTDLATALAAKQDTLTAGTGISISDNVISATGGGSSTAISVENQNTNSGAINPLKIWNGTEQEWNNGESITYYRWENEDVSATPSQVYTTDRTPTTSSKVYNPKGVLSNLTVTRHSSSGVETITLSNRGTYQYMGQSIQTLSIGESHPDYLCFINGVGVKIGTTSIVTVDQTYNASSTNAQSGVAVNSVVGNIETALQGV